MEARFEEPATTSPATLVRIYLDGDQSISNRRDRGLVYGQLTAGHETTASLLAEGLKTLLSQRERWEELCADPSLIPTAVEELLRHRPRRCSPGSERQAARHDRRDRDPRGRERAAPARLGEPRRELFSDPDAVDLRRDNARAHLSFGHGIHFCLGASLARLEVQIVLEELTRRLPSLRLAPGQTFDYSANTSFRAPSSVLAEWDTLVVPLESCSQDDVELVGGKAASLGASIRAGFPVPAGFAVTTRATEMTAEVAGAIAAAYARLGDSVPVAVRSSAIAEDSADASFAGQQDTYLWVVGEDEVLEHVRRCWASICRTARSPTGATAASTTRGCAWAWWSSAW